MSKKQDTTMPVLAHILGLVTGFIGPLIILLISKKNYEKDHAKLALNWQISLVIYGIISIILVFILIGILFLVALGVLNLIALIALIVEMQKT